MQTKHDMIVEPVGLDVEKLPKPLNFEALFGNANPVELEIGMGKGTFLTQQAKTRPDVNFIGIEWARWYWRYASDRMRRAHLTNVHTLRAEAGFFLREFIPDASLAVLHIYFPDPWPKKRHNKRRIVQPAFLEVVKRVLVPGGRLQLVTDHADYFDHMMAVLKEGPLKVIEYERPEGAVDGEVVGTNFERKYIAEGRPFHAIAAVKE
jgi:tRNA (guanine-N7-)-methyltransferase